MLVWSDSIILTLCLVLCICGVFWVFFCIWGNKTVMLLVKKAEISFLEVLLDLYQLLLVKNQLQLIYTYSHFAFFYKVHSSEHCVLGRVLFCRVTVVQVRIKTLPEGKVGFFGAT